MNMSEAVARRITELCKERDISIYRLAYLSGIPRTTLQHIAGSEKSNPRLLNIKRICDGLEISLFDFFDTDYFKNLDPEYE